MDTAQKKNLFGDTRVKKRETAALTPEDEAALSIAPSPDEVQVFCAGHEPVFTISKDGARALLSEKGLEVPSDLSGKYLSVQSCPFCAPGFESPKVTDFARKG